MLAMKLHQAVIPMAGTVHRTLPLQQLATSDGSLQRVASLQVAELREAGVDRIALIIAPDTRSTFAALAADLGPDVHLIEQPEPRGFGDAVLRAREWCRGEKFLLQVCDHLFVSGEARSCVRQLVETAAREDGIVCAVQPTHESLLPRFGVVGGRRMRGSDGLHEVDTIIEKPTPTVAEQHCIIPGLRNGHYLCFFGIHALTADVFDALEARSTRTQQGARLGLTEALADLARTRRVIAQEINGRRIDLEDQFGLLRAQLALGLSGAGRERVLRMLLEETAAAVRP
jgi:UTP--glucose-1-phosphate uridylyltransferase